MAGAPLKTRRPNFAQMRTAGHIFAEKTSATSQETTSDINSVKGRIYWNIQPGQVARIINETEFDSYNNIQGIIIPEGTTAYIRANGRTIASISGGTYNFTGSSSDSSNHLTGSLRKGWEFIRQLIQKQEKGREIRQRKLSTYNSKIWFWKTPRKEPLSLLLSYWISLSRFFSVPSKERLMLTRILSRWTYKPGIWIWR